MNLEIVIVSSENQDLLENCALGLFDKPLDKHLTTEFVSDPRRHLAVAINDGVLVGFASAVHYFHPDKKPELWINEIAVASSHRQSGIGQGMLHKLFDVARQLGCAEAWTLTEETNAAATRLYESLSGAAREQMMYSFDLRI